MAGFEIFLKQIPIFDKLTPKQIGYIAGLLKNQYIKKGEVLFREGEEGTAFFIIVTGKIKINRKSSLGDEIVLSILQSGDCLGEMSLLDGLPRSGNAEAMEDCHLYVLSRNDFLSILMEDENFMKAILSCLSGRLRKADDLREDCSFLGISSRMIKALLRLAELHGRKGKKFGEVDLHISQKEIAGLIIATRESVNKELHHLKEDGLISIKGKTITIHNIEDMKQRVNLH